MTTSRPAADRDSAPQSQKCVIATVSYASKTLTCSCGWEGTTDGDAYQQHRIAMGNRRGISSHLVKPPALPRRDIAARREKVE